MRAEELASLPISEVAYVKVFRPPFFGSFGSGEGGAIAIYTRKDNDVQYISGRGMGIAMIDGYTKCKEFYNPDYSITQPSETDVRTTLYWNPYLLTNPESKTLRVVFYNNDISKRLRVVVEGVNKDGKLTHIERVIE